MKFFDLFLPKWKNSDYKIRIIGVNSLTDIKILEKIATKDNEVLVRKAAITKITDETVLLNIFNNNQNIEIKLTVINKLKTQKILAGISISDQNLELSKAATIKIIDEIILSDIVQKSIHEDIILLAFERITNQEILAGISISDQNLELSKAATIKIIDEIILSDIVQKSIHEDIILLAFERITNQELIRKIATNIENTKIRKFVIDRITNEEVLLKVAQKDTQLIALAKLIKQESFGKVAINSLESKIRIAAIEKITNETVLSDIAKEGYIDVSLVAINRLTNQELLEDVAKNAKRIEIRIAAIEKITNETILAEIATNYSIGIETRQIAEKKITDENLKLNIVKVNEERKEKDLKAEIETTIYLGQRALSVNNYYEAIKHYDKVIKLSPKNSKSYIIRGIAKNNIRDIKGACMDWFEARKLGDSDATNFINFYCNNIPSTEINEENTSVKGDFLNIREKLLTIPFNLYLIVPVNETPKDAEKVYNMCIGHFEKDKNSYSGSLYIELSMLDSHLPVVAIFGHWEDSQGLNIPWSDLPSCNTFVDYKNVIVRKREYLNRLSKIVQSHEIKK